MSDTKQPKTQQTVTGGGSALGRYQRVIVGRRGLGRLLYFEICDHMSMVPGAVGVVLRRLFWPRLFGSCGEGVLFGLGIRLRHPHRIVLGDRVVLGDGCVLDARDERSEVALRIGADTILSNQVMLSCKNGTMAIGERVGIGAQTIVHAVAESEARIGNDVVIGPRCYLAGGGNYDAKRTDVPIAEQGLRSGEHASIEDDVWLGAGVSVLPGSTIGSGSIAAAGAVVNGDVPPRSIVGGVPARVIRSRDA